MKYVIINFSDVTQAIIDSCQQTSIETLRHSLTEPDRVILKYTSTDPDWVTALELTPKTHSEILEILEGTDWTPEEDFQ